MGNFENVVSNNKRIATNTIALYCRQLFLMFVSLYTVRSILDALGAEDYGIYNVVGGMVVMFSFLSNTMATSVQRFFAYDVGQNNIKALRETFSFVLVVFFCISIIIIVFTEIIGAWFINYKLTIPPNRLAAAKFIFQFSLFSFIITIMVIPYQSIIIARERMNIYALVSIVEGILKLSIAFILPLIKTDKLKVYGILLFIMTFTISTIYYIYCRINFMESKYKYFWDIRRIKDIATFALWNMLGSIVSVLQNHGINILLNVFFGPIINTARGIAYQVHTALISFSNNFFTAVKPQIVKYYSTEQKENMNNLVFQSSKFAFFLVMILSIPLLAETEYILNIWLKVIPEYIVVFTRLVIIDGLINILSEPLVTAIQATGRMKEHQSIVSLVIFLGFLMSYVFLKMGADADAVFFVIIAVSIITYIVRVFLVKKLLHIAIKEYIRKVLFRVIAVFLLSIIIPGLIFYSMDMSFSRFILMIGCDVLLSCIIIYLIGISKNERIVVKSFVLKKISAFGNR
jgi:O-antigen/teichoic acid export membrane protein